MQVSHTSLILLVYINLFFMKHLRSLLLMGILLLGAIPAYAQTAVTTSIDIEIDDVISASVDDVAISSESESDINDADSEETRHITGTGTLIEIGNTTAEHTTLILRVPSSSGATEDITLEITEDTRIQKDNATIGDLSDWIAGDQITFTALEYTNSGALVALTVRNRSFKPFHYGRNGWIKAINAEANTVDVEWAGTIYTLDLAEAKLVAGVKNPATIADLQVGDRVRARVSDDGDGNRLTWTANILVVLRRGEDLFMRVTRWVVPGTITSIPEDTTLPTTIEVEVAESKFYEAGDVNNLVGAPGTLVMVDITEDTKLRRRYLGNSLLDEFTEGDSVQIIGRRDESTGHIVAQYIKNNDIQKLGVAYHLGTVTAVDTTAGTITATVRGNNAVWTVQTSAETTFHIRGTEEALLEDIIVGDTIRVRGIANRQTHIVDAHDVAVVTHSVLKPDGDERLLEAKERIEERVQKIKERVTSLRAKIEQRFGRDDD